MKKIPFARIVLILAAVEFIGFDVPVRADSNVQGYVRIDQLDLAGFSAPPAEGSKIDERDIATVLHWQKTRSAAQCEQARSEEKGDFSSYYGKMHVVASPMPATISDFLNRVAAGWGAPIEQLKSKFGRRRPYLKDTDVQPCITAPATSASYPSGHAAVARIYALVLGDLLPERKKEFLKRADEGALDRVIGGVHYPSDISAGKKFADMYYATLHKNPQYLHDLETVRPLTNP